MERAQEEKNSFLYKLLRFTIVYRTYQKLVIKKSTYNFIYKNIFKTNSRSIVLDCGCGPAQYRKLIDCKKYVGIDFNKKHIQTAEKRFPLDTFINDDVLNINLSKFEKFTDILLFGLIHHLSDENSKTLINKLSAHLEVGGKIVTIDPVYVNGNSIYKKLANFVASKDQGNFVRSQNEYLELLKPSNLEIISKIYNRLLRIPFHHHIMYIQNKI